MESHRTWDEDDVAAACARWDVCSCAFSDAISLWSIVSESEK
jgi:hypothetical protein